MMTLAAISFVMRGFKDTPRSLCAFSSLAGSFPAAATGADTAITGTFVLACDFESYSGKSGALLSGVSTLGSDLYLNATLGGSAAGTIDVYLHYDMKLIIKDGILSINV